MKDWIYEEFLIFILINFSVLRSKSIFLKLQVLLLLLLLLLLLFSHPLLFTALSTFVTVIFRTVVDLYKTYFRSVGSRL